MTVLGKILVFVNLIFSLLVGALVVAVYVARTNYAVELNKARDQIASLAASRDQAFAARDRTQAELDAAVQKARADLQALDTQLKANAALADQLAAQLADEKKKVAQFAANNKGAIVDVERRQVDVERMRATLKTEMDKNTELVKLNNTLREQTTSAEIQAKALKERSDRLEVALQDMARDMAKIKQSTGGTSSSALASGRAAENPPTDSVEGLIKVADGSGLVKISIGSDAGLTKGHTLHVYRLSPVPSQSKYLGKIRILDVTSNEAVAQPITKLSAPLAPGDRVGSRILGG